ncbi:MAG: hypothetical protein PHF23_11180 [Smithellaceae bacterium]|nr:hypothetical protein [Smithellaceae bacterium]
MKKILAASVILILILIALFVVFSRRDPAPQYVTQAADRGDIRATVSATGTVNAVTTVLVGTQVSGTIKALFVDFNSTVSPG